MQWQHGMQDFFQELLKLSESIDPLHMYTAEKSTKDNSRLCSIAVIQPNITLQSNHFGEYLKWYQISACATSMRKARFLTRVLLYLTKQIGEAF